MADHGYYPPHGPPPSAGSSGTPPPARFHNNNPFRDDASVASYGSQTRLQDNNPFRDSAASQPAYHSTLAYRPHPGSSQTGNPQYSGTAAPGEAHAAPDHPPPGWTGPPSRASDRAKHASYAPPSGPPPGRSPQAAGEVYAPPPGPPPGRSPAPSGYPQRAPSPYGDVLPPSGPPPGRSPQPSHAYEPPPGPPPRRAPQPEHEVYAPPPGPPPGWLARQGREQYAPPPGPPPHRSSHAGGESYAPPAGPPPSWRGESESSYELPPPRYEDSLDAPPSGPPPTQHNWQEAVPDTALLPPPPSVGYDRSDANNASLADAAHGRRWCQSRPLQAPQALNQQTLDMISQGAFGLDIPEEFKGTLKPKGLGIWQGKTKSRNNDNCVVSHVPVYAAQHHSPLVTHRPKTIYFEVHFSRENKSEITLGLGFVARPYPPFRLPGWERASLGVHGDDGHKYVNDACGGKDFTRPFRPGETVGIGMRFSPRPPPSTAGRPATHSQSPINVDVFFVRDGRLAGEWNLHEELDATQDLPVVGLEGFHDLFAAVGSFEDVQFEIRFRPTEWEYKEWRTW